MRAPRRRQRVDARAGDDLVREQRAVELVDIDALVEALALPLRQAREAVEIIPGQVIGIVRRIEKHPHVIAGILDRLARHRIALVAEQDIGPVALAGRIEIVKRCLR